VGTLPPRWGAAMARRVSIEHCTPVGVLPANFNLPTSTCPIYGEQVERKKPQRELEFDSKSDSLSNCPFVSKLRGNQILYRKSARSEERDLLVRFATRDLTRNHVG
jgi:hypothetical protein